MTKNIIIPIEEFSDRNQLSEENHHLMQAAEFARKNAYAPYSNFFVGAALLLENGTIITGNNQENAAYPSGLCAERVAFFAASAQFPDVKIKKVAIVAGRDEQNDNAVAPCGACRQAMLEYEEKQKESIEILFSGTTGKVLKVNALTDLLPLSFSQKDL